jgi:hypothetical protein
MELSRDGAGSGSGGPKLTYPIDPDPEHCLNILYMTIVVTNTYLCWKPLVPFRVIAINTNMVCTRMYADALINNIRLGAKCNFKARS